MWQKFLAERSRKESSPSRGQHEHIHHRANDGTHRVRQSRVAACRLQVQHPGPRQRNVRRDDSRAGADYHVRSGADRSVRRLNESAAYPAHAGAGGQMKDDNVDYLAVWKKNASAEDRFLEMAMIARKHPERFGKIAIVYEETLANGCTVLRPISNGCNPHALGGTLEIGTLKVLEDTRE